MATRYWYTYKVDQAFPSDDRLFKKDCLAKAKRQARNDKVAVNVYRRPMYYPGDALTPWKLYTVCYPNGGECKYDVDAERERLAELWFEATAIHVKGCLHDGCDWSSSFVRFLREQDVNLEAMGIKLAPREGEVDKP